MNLYKNDKSNLIEDGYIVKENLKFYLTKKGILESINMIQSIDSTDFENILENKNIETDNNY